MRAVLQRVTRASVSVDGNVRGEIGAGLCVLLGIGHADDVSHARKMLHKIVSLRIFDDDQGRMNRSLLDVDGGLLIVSQFTLFADTSRGNRPSYLSAAPPVLAIPLYEGFLAEARLAIVGPVESGVFGADMQLELVNAGPVTISLEV